MGRGLGLVNRIGLFGIILAGLLIACSAVARADDSVCAQVKIEIKQTLTLERQAFDAHMRINNGLSNIALENVRVDVNFTDADGNPVVVKYGAYQEPAPDNALFFIRLDEEAMENIDDVGGSGTVPPSTSADIHWLIIPVPDSSNGLESGTLYYVGATLTYTIGGEEKTTEVTPDYIFVKPMPEITLDYFLPQYVYGDDAFTTQEELPVPFFLGVRVKNSGHGVAKNLKIDSAQPKIIDNDQGLLIGFAIEGSQVNDKPATNSLLVGFGDIHPNTSATARWTMTCSLSGRFVEFDAGFTHSDELGGELTSLITAAPTHLLVRDVLVDLPGRDAVRDFLDTDDDIFRVYESEGIDTVVPDLSAQAALQNTGDAYTLTVPKTDEFLYVRLDDPFGGGKLLAEVIRSDGKVIKPENAWLSKIRESGEIWDYYFNLFDANSTGSYTVKFKDASEQPMPPALQFIPDRTVAEGDPVGFIVESSDPNGTVPALSAAPLPAGATFVDEGTGLGAFAWQPAEGQAGVYEINYTATDGSLNTTRRAKISVQGFNDTDGDGIDDDWEMQHFGSLDRDGNGDFDHDGISDLDEFLNQTDPAGMADIAVRLAADNLNPALDEEVTLTITATNNGLRDVAGVKITDLLSSGLDYQSDDSNGSYDQASGIWNIDNLAAAGPDNSAILNLTVAVKRPGKIINIAALTESGLFDPDHSNNSAALVLDGGSQVDLSLSQTSDNRMPDEGDTIIIRLQVSNNGLDTATAVQIIDDLPAALTYAGSSASRGAYDQITGIWSVGDLNPGDGAELKLTLTVTDSTEVSNTAMISGLAQLDSDPTNNRSSLVLNQDPQNHPYVADLALFKLANREAVPVGDEAVYTVVVRNLGPDNAVDIEIDDLLPQGAAHLSSDASQGSYDEVNGLWQVGTIGPGSYAMVDTLVEITGAGEQANSAVISSSTEFDPDPGNDSTTGSITGMSADIAVSYAVAPLTATVGDQVVYTVTAGNAGPGDASGIEVAAVLPAGLSFESTQATRGTYNEVTGIWEIGALANADQATLEITVTVETAAVITATALRTDSYPTDLNSTNDSDEATVTGNVPPVVEEIPGETIDEGQSFKPIGLDQYVSDGNNTSEEISWTHSGSSQLEVTITDQHVAGIIIPQPNWYGSETVTFTATDPFGISSQTTSTFTVIAVNDPPVIQAPVSQLTAEDTGRVLAPAITVADPDVYDNKAAVSLSATNGTLSLGPTSDLNFDTGDGSADRAMSFSGSMAAINAALNGLKFDPDANYFGQASIALEINDQGHSGSGGTRAAAKLVEIAVTPVNDPPSVEIPSQFNATEGLEMTFSASATDIDSSALSYKWDFDYDGTLAADAVGIDLAAVAWTYPDNGNYTIAVQVEDGDGSISALALAQVTVADLGPTAAFSWSPEIQTEGTPVAFTNTSVSFPDAIASVSWEFGDQQISDQFNPHHSYSDNGVYTVSLKVTDDDGSMDQVERIITIVNATPIVDVGKDLTVVEGQPVNFTGSFADPGADTHQIHWEFGDGASVDGNLFPTHTYADDGVYEVTLTVTDDDGAAGMEQLKVTVNNAIPKVEAGPDQTISENETVNLNGSFTDAGAEDTHTIVWDFGDGTPPVSGSLTATHVYGDNGSFPVTLTVTDDDGGVSTDTLMITVENTVPAVEAGSDKNSIEGEQVNFAAGFTDPGSDTHTIEWDFGDGSSLTGTLNPVHTYGDNGTFTATLTVTDDDGGTGTSSLDVTVANAAPEITDMAANSPSSGVINFSAAFSDPGWLDRHAGSCDFGDGTSADGDMTEENEQPDATGNMTAVHQYAAEGRYTLSVSVTDDEGADSGLRTMDVLIDQTPPVISIVEPRNGNYDNTGDIKLDIAVADPESGGVSSGLVPESVAVTLDGKSIAINEILDLSTLDDGPHSLNVTATDYAGNAAAGVVIFEVGLMPALANVRPHRWNLDWLNPFENNSGGGFWNWLPGNTSVTAMISLGNAEAETILPTFTPAMLPVGAAYGDFVVSQVLPATPNTGYGPRRVQSVTLQYNGTGQVDALAFSGDITWDFYDLNPGEAIELDAGEGAYLNRHTVIAYYRSGPRLSSAADIVPETILLNGTVPIIADSAELMTGDPDALGQSQAAAQSPITIVKEGRQHVWLTNLGQPRSISLEVGEQVIFENEPYPLQWYDRFSLNEEGAQMAMGIFASGNSDNLRIFYHNLQYEARILLDGALALTVQPEDRLVVMKVEFDRYEAISSLTPGELETGGNWEVGTHGGVRRLDLPWKRHIILTDLSGPRAVTLMVGDSVVFENMAFPLNWRDRGFHVDGQRQDMSINSWGGPQRDKFMSIRIGRLTRRARLFFEEALVLEIVPPPEVAVKLTGSLELDGNPATFDGSFTASDRITLKGSLPDNYDIDKTYQKINSSGTPELQIGDRFGEMEVEDCTEGYDNHRITDLVLKYDGWKPQQIHIYGDSRRNHLIETRELNPGDTFVVDTREIESDRIYLKAGLRQRTVHLTGRWAAEVGDSYLDCIVTDLSQVPAGPPYYIDVTLVYTGQTAPVTITAYDGSWQAVIDSFEIDPAVNPTFTVDGSQRPAGHIGDNLVLEY
jgi:uncharacterized repeat protein (TIGR01451 family)